MGWNDRLSTRSDVPRRQLACDGERREGGDHEEDGRNGEAAQGESDRAHRVLRNVVRCLLAEAEGAGIVQTSYARVQIDLSRLKAALAV